MYGRLKRVGEDLRRSLRLVQLLLQYHTTRLDPEGEHPRIPARATPVFAISTSGVLKKVGLEPQDTETFIYRKTSHSPDCPPSPSQKSVCPNLRTSVLSQNPQLPSYLMQRVHVTQPSSGWSPLRSSEQLREHGDSRSPTAHCPSRPLHNQWSYQSHQWAHHLSGFRGFSHASRISVQEEQEQESARSE